MAWSMPFGMQSVNKDVVLQLNYMKSEIFHPDFDNRELPAHVYLRSVRNISIERSWLRLRLEFGNNAVIAFQKGEENGIYNPNSPQH